MVAEHRVSAFGLLFRCLVLDHVPVLNQNSGEKDSKYFQILGSLGSGQDQPARYQIYLGMGAHSKAVHSYLSPLTLINVFHPNQSLFRRLPGCAAMVAASCLATVEIEMAAPVSNREQVAPSSNRAWAPPNLPEYENALRKGSAAALDKGKQLVDLRKEYTLPELIDLGERLNPATRAAWQNAKQALALLGVSKSAYYPFLSLAASAGYTRLFVPFPKLQVSQEALKRALATGGPLLSAVTLTEGPPLHFDILYQSELTMKWLLFDFGQREATISAAREGLLMANVAFNATHQRVVFEVSQSFYAYNLARESVRVAESAAETAQTVDSAVQARVANGLATQPESLQAKQQLAQAQFNLEKARGSQRDAFVDLMKSIGLSPSLPIRITESFAGSVEIGLETPLASLVMRALSQRPDLVVSLAKVRAAEDKIKAIKASYFPKISALANLGYGMERTSLSGNTFDDSAPTFGAGLGFELQVFDGFLRDRSLQAARAELEAASEELQQTRDEAVRQVWKSYIDLRTAIRSGAAAAALLKSSQGAYDAVLASFKLGFSTYTDVVTNETKLTSARNSVFETQSAIHQAATALAYAMGELGNTSKSMIPAGKK
jgi:outer membrane protein TolC